MEQQEYLKACVTDFDGLVGHPMRTSGCVLIVCTEGRAVVECNFRLRPLRKGSVMLVFSDTIFSVRRTGGAFSARYFELSAALTDETTFTSSGSLFDWLEANPVFAVPQEHAGSLALWLESLDRIAAGSDGKFRNIMLRNHWHNFFIGLEAMLDLRGGKNGVKTISSSRKLFDSFCRLLFENCRKHHDVKFYADRLCVTPYYLSCITRRIYDVSPKEMIDREIVMEIKSLLTSTDLSVKEIAHLYGFESSSYLGRFFRRNTGLTPTQFRDSHN